MPERDQIIEKIKSIPEDSVKEIADFIELLEEKERRKKKGEKKEEEDILSKVIGICEGPSDLAERHDKYVYG